MPERMLTLRELNRATLARQMLLARETMPIPAAVERLVGLQAQLNVAPYVGLWTRLTNFARDDLARLIEHHRIIKATLMRATLHLFTAEDYLLFRATLQPVLTNAFESVLKTRAQGLDVPKLVATAREFIAEKPRTFAEITAMFTELMPDMDEGVMRYGTRTHLSLVQVPTSTRWSYPGNPQFTLAETWLGKSIPTDDQLPILIKRYLAAFGPASVTDIQTWSGLPKLKEAVDKLRPELVTYRSETKTELFDLPDAPTPDADIPAPERFLPEFDNILLSHQKRTRVVADEYRKGVYLPGLRVAATILLDGFVRGAWKAESKKGAAALTITPFAPLTKANRAALTDEGEPLLRFLEPDAKTYEVKFTE
jgi:hypothetical protein